MCSKRMMFKGLKKAFSLGVCTLGLGCTLPALATSYGIFDPRSLGMGGATVAAGSSNHAHFYNPALLSFENEDEDESENGRFIFPAVLALSSDAGRATAEIVSDDLPQEITDAVNRFNASPADAASQQALLNALEDFDSAINDLNQQSIEFEGFVGLSVSEPADREGGSFYFGVRGLVLGQAQITDADLILMDDYISALDGLVNNGTAIPAALLDANGNLADPRQDLTSEAPISSLAIGEWGIALSKEFDLWGQPVAFGVTPKIMQVDVYREDVNFVDDVPSYTENRKSHLTMNIDFGVAADLFDNYRVGIAFRDLIPKTFESENNLEIDLKPRARLGLAYINEFLTIGFDYDIQKNKPVATEPENQEIALGLEVRPWENIDLRVGYRQDTASDRDDILSAGIRYQFWRVIAEASIATSDDTQGGALQIGWAF